jgi:hypothetical protein
MDHSQDILDGLTNFASGKWGWQRWRRWLAMYARSMSKMLSTEQMRSVKLDPQKTVPQILSERGMTVVPWIAPPEVASRDRHDPIEDDPAMQPILAAARRAAEIEAAPTLAKFNSDIGNCHLLWRLQKRILKEQFGIDWKTPAEMNPDIRYD